jgi:hypothetical protein
MTIYLDSNDDDEVEFFLKSVKPLTSRGLLNIVLWQWPKSDPFHLQAASQFSCIYRAKRRVRWLGMNDLDEMFVSERNWTIEQEIRSLESTSDAIDGIFANHRYVQPGVGGDFSFPVLRKACSSEWPIRGKTIARTEYAYAMHVHWVTMHTHLPGIVHLEWMVVAHVRRGTRVIETMDYPYIRRILDRLCPDYSPCTNASQEVAEWKKQRLQILGSI